MRREGRVYGFPPRFVAWWLVTATRGGQRSLGRDAERLLAGRRPPPRAIDVGHIPASGLFIAVMNHYERPGLRVWWPALWVSALVWRARREDPPLRWLVTSEFYRFHVGPLPLPDRCVRWLLASIAARYGLITVARSERSEATLRSAAVRQAQRALHAPGGRARPIGITPEAARGHGCVLSRPSRNTGIALAHLSQGAVPLLPVAVYEDASGTLTARFGEPFTLSWQGLRVARAAEPPLSELAMRRVAALLPARLRGPYAEELSAAPPPDGMRA